MKSMAERRKVPHQTWTNVKESHKRDFASEVFAISPKCFMLNLPRLLQLKSERKAATGEADTAGTGAERQS